MSTILRSIPVCCRYASLPILLLTSICAAPGQDILLRDFRPKAMLQAPATPLTAARMPVVDVHTHMFYRTRHNAAVLDDFVQLMDRNNIAVCTSMDGGLGERFLAHRRYLWHKYRDRFVIFANIDWQGPGTEDQPETWAVNQPEFVPQTVAAIRQAVAEGASGLKIFKRFGLSYRDRQGQLIKIDDARFDPIWQVCGELKIPVLIHTADPAAFFLPVDETNERIEELTRHPDWSFYGPQYPSREELLAARNRVIERHPETNFIGAHFANNPEDLAEVGRWLDQYPNLYIEPASRIAELGRQPYTSRDFFIRYADRILFGTDGPWPEARLRLYWRFLETRDEYFPYAEDAFPPQGFWRIYGIYLGDDVLEKVYYGNASRLIPGVRERVEKFADQKLRSQAGSPSPEQPAQAPVTESE